MSLLAVLRRLFRARPPLTPYAPQPPEAVSYARAPRRWRGRWRTRRYQPDPDVLPYRAASGLLSPAEYSFCRVLLTVVEPAHMLVPKVRLADLAEVDKQRHASGTWEERHWFRRIAPMHVDFVLCERETLRPLTAIELDDSSHRTNPQQRQSDAWKARVLAQIGLRLLRVPYQRGYTPGDLAAALYPRG